MIQNRVNSSIEHFESIYLLFKAPMHFGYTTNFVLMFHFISNIGGDFIVFTLFSSIAIDVATNK